LNQVAIDPELLESPILILDDQPPNVKLLERILIKYGFENVHTLTDSREFEATIQAIEFDLILLDIRMPHLDGFDILKIMAAKYGGEVPVLVLTAQTDNETRDRALELGATDFLRKPFDKVEVMLRVKNMLRGRSRQKDEVTVKNTLANLVHQQTNEMGNLLREIVRRLGRASEYRDNETGLHIIRMSKYCRLMASKLGYSDIDAENLEYAATMHDIGKIATPDSVLLKPGKLDADEWAKMQEHTVTGAIILASTKYALLQKASEISLCHHEKFNGQGYPNGLAGEDIPFDARIVAVADVFDALTTARPYKKA